MSIAPILTLALALGPSAPASPTDDPLMVARCPYEPPSLPDDSEVALDATLLVRSSEGTGSAVLISPDGFALTAAHVVGDDRSVGIIAHGGAELSAQVVRLDTDQDVALLKVETDGDSSCLPLTEDEASLGSEVFILGSPAGEALSFSVSKGVVSGYRTFEDTRFVQLDASVNPGNSGGPAVDASGTVVGIASWKISHVSMEGLAFAVPADTALHALGVELGDESSADWMERIHLNGAEQDAAQSPSSTTAPELSEAFAPAQIRKERARRALIATGIPLFGAGIFVIAGTAIAYSVKNKVPPEEQLDRGWTRRRWRTVRGINTLGWSLSIAGAAMTAAGFAIPVRIRKNDKNEELSVLPTPTGLSVRGRF